MHYGPDKKMTFYNVPTMLVGDPIINNPVDLRLFVAGVTDPEALRRSFPEVTTRAWFAPGEYLVCPDQIETGGGRGGLGLRLPDRVRAAAEACGGRVLAFVVTTEHHDYSFPI